MKRVIIVMTAFIFVFAVSCKKTDIQPTGLTNTPGANYRSDSPKGIQTTIPAYYDSTLFKILFVEFSSKAEASLIAHNPGINFIYQSDNGLPDNQPFISVID